MLPKPYDHQEYLRQVHSSEAVAAMVTSPNAQVRELWSRLLRLVAAADPSSFHPDIRSWYAPIGRPPKDPYRIMRSLLLMIYLGHGSVREWYLTLHHSSALAALCGWSADEPLPAIGTFYMFSHRACQTSPCRGVIRRKQRRIKGTKGEKLKPRRPQVVSRLLERYRRHPPKPPFPRWLSLWAKVLAGSLERGLLGNLDDVFYVGDGSPVPSGANDRGHKTCDHGREPCDCPRRYADPGARFGWDPNRECTFFGRHLVTIAALGPCGPLPLYPRFYQGNRHDGVAFFCAQEEMFQILPGRVRLTKLAHDSAADILAIYQRCEERGITPFIDLNRRGTKEDACGASWTHQLPHGLRLDDQGRILCPAGIPTVPRGSSHHGKYQHLDCPKRRHPELKVSCPDSCHLSTKTASLKRAAALRLLTPVPRGSPTFQRYYKKRTYVEQWYKQAKVDFAMATAGHRSDPFWNTRLYLTAMLMHFMAWAGLVKEKPMLREVLGT
jgi:hypothetical protein